MGILSKINKKVRTFPDAVTVAAEVTLLVLLIFFKVNNFKLNEIKCCAVMEYEGCESKERQLSKLIWVKN